ncbi:MAG TPA: 2-dehydropantoate 2-reductase [Anaerolineales bacterium]|nr:2-dehydropantoate 2-reductase [Anaerolineales bacterium]
MSSWSDLRWLVFGAGAIGTYIGGSLALHGQEVIFLEQPAVAQELRARGLRLQLPDGEHHLPQPKICASIEEALTHWPFDVAVFALKSYDTQAALQSLAPHTSQLPSFLCLQNGVDNEPALAAVIGPDKVISGTVSSAVGRRAAGDIALERLRGMGVAKGHPLSERMVGILTAAGLNARLYLRAADMKWSKMLTNLTANATSAILDLPPAEVFAHPGLCRLEIEQLREALRVMAAQRIRVVDLPGTPVRLLALGMRLPPALARPLLQRGVGRGRGGKMPSFHIDLHSGRGKSEVNYLNGAVVRAGESLGIPTPVNRLLNDTLLALTQGQLKPEAFAHQPHQLLRLLG